MFPVAGLVFSYFPFLLGVKAVKRKKRTEKFLVVYPILIIEPTGSH